MANPLELTGGELITPRTLRLGSLVHTSEDFGPIEHDNATIRSARARVLGLLYQKRTPYLTQTAPWIIRMESGPTFTDPLLHFGYAMSMQEIRQYAMHFNVDPQNTVDISQYSYFEEGQDSDSEDEDSDESSEDDTPLEQSLTAKIGVQDKLLKYLQTELNLPGLRFVRCLNVDDRIWILVLRSNFSLDPGSDRGTTPAHDAQQTICKKLNHVLQDYGTTEEEKKKKQALQGKWYWNHELCGINYLAPQDEHNIWPGSEENNVFRAGWRLEDMTNPAERDALRYFPDPGLVLGDDEGDEGAA